MWISRRIQYGDNTYRIHYKSFATLHLYSLSVLCNWLHQLLRRLLLQSLVVPAIHYYHAYIINSFQYIIQLCSCTYIRKWLNNGYNYWSLNMVSESYGLGFRWTGHGNGFNGLKYYQVHHTYAKHQLCWSCSLLPQSQEGYECRDDAVQTSQWKCGYCKSEN